MANLYFCCKNNECLIKEAKCIIKANDFLKHTFLEKCFIMLYLHAK